MTKYEIPLSEVYEDGLGTRVIIDNGSVSIVNRTDDDRPNDLVRIRQTEIPKLIEILTARLTEEGNFGQLSNKYEEYEQ